MTSGSILLADGGGGGDDPAGGRHSPGSFALDGKGKLEAGRRSTRTQPRNSPLRDRKLRREIDLADTAVS